MLLLESESLELNTSSVRARGRRLVYRRKIFNVIFLSLCAFAAGIGIFFLSFIMWSIIKNGIMGINWSLFLEDYIPTFLDESGGGLRYAFVGQIMLIVVAAVIGVTIGVLSGIFVGEYSRFYKFAHYISNIADMLVSIPSIIIGAFVYSLIVVNLGGFSGFAGAFALALIMIPMIARVTEDMLKFVPNELREAAIALGVPYHRMVIDVVFRSALAGIMTGVVLGIARVAGETAPLLLTALSSDDLTFDMTRPFPSLTVVIYKYSSMSDEAYLQLAWAGCFVITIFMLLINVFVRYLISVFARHSVRR